MRVPEEATARGGRSAVRARSVRRKAAMPQGRRGEESKGRSRSGGDGGQDEAGNRAEAVGGGYEAVAGAGGGDAGVGAGPGGGAGMSAANAPSRPSLIWRILTTPVGPRILPRMLWLPERARYREVLAASGLPGPIAE